MSSYDNLDAITGRIKVVSGNPLLPNDYYGGEINVVGNEWRGGEVAVVVELVAVELVVE